MHSEIVIWGDFKHIIYWVNPYINCTHISYSNLFICKYFNQRCCCVTFTDSNDPLGSDHASDPETTQNWLTLHLIYPLAIVNLHICGLTSQLANTNYKGSYLLVYIQESITKSILLIHGYTLIYLASKGESCLITILMTACSYFVT